MNDRGIYYLQEKPHNEKPSFQFTFYTKPTGEFKDVIYICELNQDLTRWAVMKRPCMPERGIKYGYK